MRQRYSPQSDFDLVPIEKIVLPLKSRDELPPILAGLQWIWTHPTLKAEVFTLLEAKILAGKKATGRTGMDLWPVLVLGVVRLGLDADYDRLEHLANYDSLLAPDARRGPSRPGAPTPRVFAHQTLRGQRRPARRGGAARDQRPRRRGRPRRIQKKDAAPAEPLAIKVDPYVLETDVHFPPDLNLLWDAGRKCVELIAKYRAQFGYALPGWRQARDWRRRLKDPGAQRPARRGAAAAPARKRACARPPASMLMPDTSSPPGCRRACSGGATSRSRCRTGSALAYFHAMLVKHLDLVKRRLLRGETIPAAEKLFSLFEPHPEWIQKGKARPNVELGHRLLIATDQHELIQDYDVPVGGADVDQSVPVADRLLPPLRRGQSGQPQFRQGFHPRRRPGAAEPSTCRRW